jgi:taurine---2-oxoglutarate transaminase
MNNSLRTPTSNDAVRSADTDSVFHSWSAQATLAPFVIAGGKGSEVWDYEGNTYLDFSSMLVNVNIGHQHPKVIEAIHAQADILTTVAPAHANNMRALAAEKILAHAPDKFTQIFFTNGGADANENAIRMARIHTGRDKVISFYRSYHGNTGAAIVATGDWRRIPNEYSRGHVHVFGPHLYRTEYWSTTPEQETDRALHHLERVIQAQGPDSIAAFLIETVPGTAGILTPPPGYLKGVRALADKYGIILILDEVMAGFGRTGEWFAFDAFDVVPDLITFAKGVNSGYIPVGGVIISGDIAKTFDERVFPGGLTYSGHPLASASIVAAIGAMEEEGVIENARTIGETVLGPGLRELQAKHDVIGDVRGSGVFWALEFVTDRETREPVPAAWMGKLKTALFAANLVPFMADNRLHVVPPCVVTAEEARRGIEIIDRVLAELK